MAWTLDMTRANLKKWDFLDDKEQEVWLLFQRAIQAGVHPRTAAEQLGRVGGKDNAGYNKLRGTDNQYEIRLSQSHRATFLVVDGSSETVVVLQVGGHT